MIAQQNKIIVSDVCHRCGGLMVPEWTDDPSTTGWRCVSCGERIDPVILTHRKQNRAREEAAQLFAGAGSPKLN